MSEMIEKKKFDLWRITKGSVSTGSASSFGKSVL